MLIRANEEKKKLEKKKKKNGQSLCSIKKCAALLEPQRL